MVNWYFDCQKEKEGLRFRILCGSQLLVSISYINYNILQLQFSFIAIGAFYIWEVILYRRIVKELLRYPLISRYKT